MAQISRKKSIIKKRQTTFKRTEGHRFARQTAMRTKVVAKEEGIGYKLPQTKGQKVLGWLSSGAAYVERKRKDPATRKAVGSFLERMAEGGRRFGEAQRAKSRKPRTTTKKHKKSRR